MFIIHLYESHDYILVKTLFFNSFWCFWSSNGCPLTNQSPVKSSPRTIGTNFLSIYSPRGSHLHNSSQDRHLCTRWIYSFHLEKQLTALTWQLLSLKFSPFNQAEVHKLMFPLCIYQFLCTDWCTTLPHPPTLALLEENASYPSSLSPGCLKADLACSWCSENVCRIYFIL